MKAIGLMSGTSMDGIDVGLIETDGHVVDAFGPAETFPYPDALRASIAASLGGVGDIAAVERALTLAHAEAVEKFLARNGIDRDGVDLVGFHGHTILHRPDDGRTWQAGDGALLAARTGIDVVCDFRSADVAAGGQGAPFAPLFHAALADPLEKPLAVLNLGGIGNLTWLGEEGAILAFDTGPGNGLIDAWCKARTGRDFDADGALAAKGKVDDAALSRYLASPYFARRPPKSLDRLDFDLAPVDGLGAEDGAATLAALTCEAVHRALEHLPATPRRWLVCGGGRHNPTIMAGLRARLGVSVESVEAVGWNGDALEAQAFAFLAVRSRLGLPLSVPGTTGVPAPTTGGRFFAAPRPGGGVRQLTA